MKQSLLCLLYECALVVRRLLIPSGVCIYPITCSEHARLLFKEKHFLIALMLTCLRILSCNPVTALFLHYRFKRKNQRSQKNVGSSF